MSALSPRGRDSVRATLLKAGRWLEAEQPQAADPASWTRQTCAAWVAAVDRMKVGEYVQRTAGLKDQLGKPLEAATKAGPLAALRTFFVTCRNGSRFPGASIRSARWRSRAASWRGAGRQRDAAV
jgi:hypothetical protein